jgi:hypothetical protein
VVIGVLAVFPCEGIVAHWIFSWFQVFLRASGQADRGRVVHDRFHILLVACTSWENVVKCVASL